MADRPSATAEQTHEVLNLEGARTSGDKQTLLMLGGRTQRRIVIWFRRGGIKLIIIRNYFRCRSRGVVPQEHLTVI